VVGFDVDFGPDLTWRATGISIGIGAALEASVTPGTRRVVSSAGSLPGITWTTSFTAAYGFGVGMDASVGPGGFQESAISGVVGIGASLCASCVSFNLKRDTFDRAFVEFGSVMTGTEAFIPIPIVPTPGRW
jgi:hypothetical protein